MADRCGRTVLFPRGRSVTSERTGDAMAQLQPVFPRHNHRDETSRRIGEDVPVVDVHRIFNEGSRNWTKTILPRIATYGTLFEGMRSLVNPSLPLTNQGPMNAMRARNFADSHPARSTATYGWTKRCRTGFRSPLILDANAQRNSSICCSLSG